MAGSAGHRKTIGLERLEPRGALAIFEAIGTQTKIAQKVVDRGGDDLLALKENWGPRAYCLARPGGVCCGVVVPT